MRPSKFVAAQERRLRRPLTGAELQAVQSAREFSQAGKRDTVKAMRAALSLCAAEQIQPPMNKIDHDQQSSGELVPIL